MRAGLDSSRMRPLDKAKWPFDPETWSSEHYSYAAMVERTGNLTASFRALFQVMLRTPEACKRRPDALLAREARERALAAAESKPRVREDLDALYRMDYDAAGDGQMLAVRVAMIGDFPVFFPRYVEEVDPWPGR